MNFDEEEAADDMLVVGLHIVGVSARAAAALLRGF